ncbi:hypothetical protein Tco_0740951 [Tanacetum coccineum]
MTTKIRLTNKFFLRNLNDDMYNWVIVKYGKPNSWTYSQFHSIADDVYTTFFEKCEHELAEPEKAEAETAEPEMFKKIRCPRVFKYEGKRGSTRCSPWHSYDESSSSDESGCLENNVHGSMKITISQKDPSKDLLNWFEDVNDQDEEEIDEKMMRQMNKKMR